MKSALEAVLQAMITGGWANESDGEVEAPTGAFARVSNSEAELGEVVAAFIEEITTYGMDDTSILIGNFLVIEDSQGNVYVSSYDDETQLTRDFQILQDAYSLWAEDANA